MPTESQIQSRLLKELNKYGWFYNTNDRFRAGVPDILGAYEGWFIAIEVKVNGRPVTPLQRFELNRIESSGGVACVVDYDCSLKIYIVKHKNITTKHKNTRETIEWILRLSPSSTNKSATIE